MRGLSTKCVVLSAVVGLFVAGGTSRARARGGDEATRPLSLEEAVETALARHPHLAAARADEAAAAARIDEAETGKLPTLAVAAQINRSTGNTVPGAFFPAREFVPIAGALRGKTFDEGVWQSGASLWASWDVLALARQAAAVDVALASQREASAVTSAERLEIAYRAADAFLLLLEADETVRAALTNVGRANVLVAMTRPLVEQSLRPGVDLARAEAELAGAQIAEARAEQAREVRRAALAEAIGRAGTGVDAAPGHLAEPVDESGLRPARAAVDGHPAVVRAAAAAERASEARRLVDVQYLPRVDLVASLWMRGSGLFASPASGLVPDVPNWAAGAVASWSLLDIPTIRARARAAEATETAARARREEAALTVAGQLANAAAVLEGAVRVARQTPAALASARAAEQQATARFKTGLAPIVDVADAERVLAQAEIDDAVARLEIRRAMLLFARASGDLRPFLAQVAQK